LIEANGRLGINLSSARYRETLSRKLHTDNGLEFSFTFLLAVERRGIHHRYIKPRRPDQNGKVERSHRVDAEELGARHTVASRGRVARLRTRVQRGAVLDGAPGADAGAETSSLRPRRAFHAREPAR